MRSPETNRSASRPWRRTVVTLMLVLGIGWYWSAEVSEVSAPGDLRSPAVGHRGAAPAAITKRQPQSPAPFVRSGASADTESFRSSARKAVPVTRGKELDTRFRPDDRASPYGEYSIATDPLPAADDIDFRPIPKKRRPTYEELQAGEFAEQSPPPPPLPMPLLPGVQPGPYWRP